MWLRMGPEEVDRGAMLWRPMSQLWRKEPEGQQQVEWKATKRGTRRKMGREEG